MLVHRAIVLAALFLATRGAARAAAAQGTTNAPAAESVQVTFVPEGRLDLLSSPTALHAGIGVATPFSNYFSLGADVAGGISSDGFSGRLDGFGRFSLDPYHQFAWEPYLGGGVTVRADAGGRGARTYLLALAGVTGPAAGGVVPGVEFGLGGGVRLGVILRRAPATARGTPRR